MPTMPLQDKQDSSLFSESAEDNIVRSSSENGRVYSRPRTAGAPRRIFTTGFTHINQASKLILQAFEAEIGFGALSFTWTNPTDNEDIQVRTTTPFEYKYVGIGGIHRYDVKSITLVEVL